LQLGRGIVFGGLIGLVFSGLVLALVSQMTGRRSLDAPFVPVAGVSEPSGADGPDSEGVADLPAATDAVAGSDGVQGDGPEAPLAPSAQSVAPGAPSVEPPVSLALSDGRAVVTPEGPSVPAAEMADTAAPVQPQVENAPAAPDVPPDPEMLPAVSGEDALGRTEAAAVPAVPAASVPVSPSAPPAAPDPAEYPQTLVIAEPAEPAPGVPASDTVPETGEAPNAPSGPGPVLDTRVPTRTQGGLIEAVPVAPIAESAPFVAGVAMSPIGPGPVISGLAPGLADSPDPVLPVAPVARFLADLRPTDPAPNAPSRPDADPALARPQTVSPITAFLIAPARPAPDLPDTDPAAPLAVASVPQAGPPPIAPLPGQIAAPLPETGTAPTGDIAQSPSPGTAAIVTDRLPRIGGAPDPDDAAIAPIPDAVPPADALTRNSVTFDNPEGRPIVSVVLLDDGAQSAVELPFPVSVALDGAAADAAERAAGYRAAGVEVLIRPQIPAGAVASDVAVALADTFRRIPDAVALLDSPEGTLQANREILGQVLAEVSETGHALLAFSRGLNTAMQVAAREGVIAGLVFRDIDGAGQDLRAIKRFLDQAAFRARQEDAVILIGRNQPDTIAALTEWAQGNRAGSIALAPVSAALKVTAR